jgi:hypothetical protein
MLIRWISAAFVFLLSGVCHAALVGPYVVNIQELWTYTDYTGVGDAVITVNASAPTCDGYWLRQSDPGSKNTLALLLAAKAQNATIKIYAYDDQIWSGSSGKYCRIYTIAYVG